MNAAAISRRATSLSSTIACSFRADQWGVVFGNSQEGIVSRDKDVADKDGKDDKEDEGLHINQGFFWYA